MRKYKPFKIRPFNMANFSGGSGYMPVIFMFQAAFIIPLYCILVVPFTYIFGNEVKLIDITDETNEENIVDVEEGKNYLDNVRLISGLKKVILPILAIISIALFIYCLETADIYSSNTIAVVLSSVAIAFIPNTVIYCYLRLYLKRHELVERKKIILYGIKVIVFSYLIYYPIMLLLCLLL